jgi:hypothetical protein
MSMILAARSYVESRYKSWKDVRTGKKATPGVISSTKAADNGSHAVPAAFTSG